MHIAFCWSCLALVLTVPAQGKEYKKPLAPHRWSHIAYPDLPFAGQPKHVHFYDFQLAHDKQWGLSFHFTCSVREGKDYPAYQPSKELVAVRWYSPDGKVHNVKPPDPDDPLSSLRIWPQISNLLMESRYLYAFHFDWGTNALEAAWIEVRTKDQVFWLEVPYGFTRNPAAPLPTAAKPPDDTFKRLPWADKPGVEPNIIPWLYVQYELGTTQNGWGLTLNQANPYMPEAELVLYRNDSQVGKSMYLWDLHSPRTAIKIDHLGRTIGSQGMSVRLHQDGLRRSDVFQFPLYPRDTDPSWGTARITVEGQTYSCTLPSSLFQARHGSSANDPFKIKHR